MVFSSVVFLCMFLPIVVGVYYLLPGKFRNVFLTIASLFFYAYGEPVYIFIMLFSTVFDYCNGQGISYFRDKDNKGAQKAILILSMIGNLGILGFFKYTDFAIGTVNNLAGMGIKTLGLALPIGISFYTFQTMSYTIDVYRGRVKSQKNFIDFAMYVCMFPQLIAGPIVTYAHVEKEIHTRKESLSQVTEGLQRFSIGLGKKVLLANQIGTVFEEMNHLSGGDRSMAAAWLGAIAYSFQIYFDFSGYSDMAIGLGKIFGFHFPENFDHPYEAKSVTEFWRRWHMTLGGWFREYVYIPLGGNRCKALRHVFNMLVVWFLTGLWHGASWNFVLWGLYYFLFLMVEKSLWSFLARKKELDRTPSYGHFYTMLVVVIGWVLFSCEDLSTLGERLMAMAGIGVDFANRVALHYWTSNGAFLVLLCLGATTLPKRLAKKLLPKKLWDGGLAVYSLALLLVCAAFLIGGSYNPFLYFRF